jgi:flavodoxin I
MNILVIYDSLYGNTRSIAEAIAGAFGGPDEVRLLQAGEAQVDDLKSVGLLVVGAPTHGGRPSPGMQEFLARIPADALKGVNVAAFDTRFGATDQGIGLRLLMKIIDYAAPRIADTLKGKGGSLAAPPEGFIVVGKEGPLKEGEPERAASWARDKLGAR